jgi:hypothetical protein
MSVNLTVTRWADASAAFTDLVADTGVCRWVDVPVPATFTARGTSSSWAATSDFSTLHYGRAVVRVGDLVAGVEVQSPAGSAAARATAEILVSSLVPRLKKAAEAHSGVCVAPVRVSRTWPGVSSQSRVRTWTTAQPVAVRTAG